MWGEGVWYSVLQCITMCCSVLQCELHCCAACDTVRLLSSDIHMCVIMCYSVLLCVAVGYSVLQLLQCVAVSIAVSFSL